MMPRSLEEIRASYQEHLMRPFPEGCVGLEQSVDWATLDTFAAGCVSTFLGSSGTLDAKRVEILARCRADLTCAIDSLGGDEREYFERLAEIAAGVLGFLGHPIAGA